MQAFSPTAFLGLKQFFATYQSIHCKVLNIKPRNQMLQIVDLVASIFLPVELSYSACTCCKYTAKGSTDISESTLVDPNTLWLKAERMTNTGNNCSCC